MKGIFKLKLNVNLGQVDKEQKKHWVERSRERVVGSGEDFIQHKVCLMLPVCSVLNHQKLKYFVSCSFLVAFWGLHFMYFSKHDKLPNLADMRQGPQICILNKIFQVILIDIKV